MAYLEETTANSERKPPTTQSPLWHCRGYDHLDLRQHHTHSAISNRATTTTRIELSKAGGTDAALNCLVSKERLPPMISRQCVRVSTHKRENSYGNVTGQIALPAMVRSKVRRALFMT